jgi:hypothetical protein
VRFKVGVAGTLVTSLSVTSQDGVATRAVAGSPFEHQVWRCRLPLSKPVLKAPTLHRLKLEWHKLFSFFAVIFNLRRYIPVTKTVRVGATLSGLGTVWRSSFTPAAPLLKAPGGAGWPYQHPC